MKTLKMRMVPISKMVSGVKNVVMVVVAIVVGGDCGGDGGGGGGFSCETLEVVMDGYGGGGDGDE